MSSKRASPATSETATEQPAKRPKLSPSRGRISDSEDHRHGNLNRGNQQPRVDPTYGQKAAFPGLEDDDEDFLPYGGDPTDGIEYLRLVRSEARGVPHLLLAPLPIEQTNTNGETNEPRALENGGHYYDGAYTAGPSAHADVTTCAQSKAQQAYYDSLFLRFNLLRATLKCAPPISAVEALTSSQPISFPSNSKRAHSEWQSLVNNADPHMTQMACIDNDSLLRLLELLTRLIPPIVKGRNVYKIRRLGAWAWAILGKCREVGELGSEEVSDLRELGKIAAGALYGFQDRSGNVYGEDAEEEEEEEGEEGGGEKAGTLSSQDEEHYDTVDDPDLSVEGHSVAQDTNALHENIQVETAPGDEPANPTGDLELEEAKRQLEEQVHAMGGQDEHDVSPEISDAEDEGGLDFEKRARATLDMILTIIGELYGQRDLLELRDEWNQAIEG